MIVRACRPAIGRFDMASRDRRTGSTSPSNRTTANAAQMTDQPINSTGERTDFGEPVQLRAQLGDSAIVVTDRRLVVVTRDRQSLDVPLEGVRRIQFDIERSRPATLIVPEHASHEPQVLAVHHDYYEEVAGALVLVGRRLAEPA